MKYEIEAYRSGSIDILDGEVFMKKAFHTSSDLREILLNIDFVQDYMYRLKFNDNNSIIMNSPDIVVDDIISIFNKVTNTSSGESSEESIRDAKDIQ